MLGALASSRAAAPARAGRRSRAAHADHQHPHQPRRDPPPPGPIVDHRREVVDDIHAEVEQLDRLVDEIVAVAIGGLDDDPYEPSRSVSWRVTWQPATSAGAGERCGSRPTSHGRRPARRVQRAMSCLLDNATKFDTSGGVIDVRVSNGTVEVTDRGSGIAEAERDAGVRALPAADGGADDARLGTRTVDRARHHRAAPRFGAGWVARRRGRGRRFHPAAPFGRVVGRLTRPSPVRVPIPVLSGVGAHPSACCGVLCGFVHASGLPLSPASYVAPVGLTPAYRMVLATKNDHNRDDKGVET